MLIKSINNFVQLFLIFCFFSLVIYVIGAVSLFKCAKPSKQEASAHDLFVTRACLPFKVEYLAYFIKICISSFFEHRCVFYLSILIN